MHAQIRRVGVLLIVLMLLVFANLNYVQIFAAEGIAENPANYRALLAEAAIKRGTIVTADGVTLARSVETNQDLKYRRVYPEGELYGPITGYYNLINGTRAGIENAYNEQLLGDTGVLTMQDFEDRFLESGAQGDDVQLTIDSRLQELASSSLGQQNGAVIALDPNSGDVRAMWGFPSYDPNPLSSYNKKEALDYRATLEPRAPDSPLIGKVARRLYPPGSTFKVITTAAALESGDYQPDSTFDDPDSIGLPLTDQRLTNFTKTSCQGGGQIDLFTALEISCDTTFALIGLQIPGELKATAEDFGFNSPIPFDLTTDTSTFPDIPDDEEPLRAYAGIGQGDVAATPLQMALVAAAVANGGQVPRPRIVKEVIDPRGGVVERYSPETIGRVMTSEHAEDVKDMMVAVVQSASGTGTAAQIPGVEVAGKTGTAQSAEGAAPHAWFISFAPANDPQIAVAILVENGGSVGSEATGGAIAAPIAKAIIERDRELRGW
ncbi:MAG: penicillin-binding transpeptidase domain-containing protein [Actinomycetota bacterium]|nr:penicillin-binding transpeptidase domain-containing protein [Actinomycetota bacterium]